jgi:hypothetical protein
MVKSLESWFNQVQSDNYIKVRIKLNNVIFNLRSWINQLSLTLFIVLIFPILAKVYGKFEV